MTWRVVITPDAVADGIAVQIARRLDGGRVQTLRFEQTAELVEAGTEMPHASIKLTDDLAMMLLDALADHFGNTSGGRQQRADFVHERARVDRLIDVVAGALSSSLQTPADLYAESRPEGRRVVESPDIPGRDRQPGGAR